MASHTEGSFFTVGGACGIIRKSGYEAVSIARIVGLLRHRYLTLASRLVLGGVFIFSGVAKLPNLQTFVWEVGQYHLLPPALATAYAYVLPGLELALGLLLVLGLFLRVSSAVSILVVVSFSIAKVSVLARGLDIAMCGCFGPAVTLLMPTSLAIDLVLLALGVQILLHRGEFLALGPWISQRLAQPED